MPEKSNKKKEQPAKTEAVKSSIEKDDKIVEQAIKNNNKVVASAVQKAIDKNNQEKEEAQTEVILTVLKSFDESIQTAVTNLQTIRRQEMYAKKKVITLSKAKDLFTETADADKTLKFLRENDLFFTTVNESLARLKD